MFQKHDGFFSQVRIDHRVNAIKTGDSIESATIQKKKRNITNKNPEIVSKKLEQANMKNNLRKIFNITIKSKIFFLQSSLGYDNILLKRK